MWTSDRPAEPPFPAAYPCAQERERQANRPNRSAGGRTPLLPRSAAASRHERIRPSYARRYHWRIGEREASRGSLRLERHRRARQAEPLDNGQGLFELAQ